MNTNAAMLAIILWFVCTFVALAFFISRINSVRKAANDANEKVNERIDSFADSIYDLIHTLTERITKLEDSKICVLETSRDEVGETYLCAITKDGYSTVVVSLTEDELAAIESFVDWADLEEDFSMVKIDKNYVAEDWGKKK